jgi:hypothetical protein
MIPAEKSLYLEWIVARLAAELTHTYSTRVRAQLSIALSGPFQSSIETVNQGLCIEWLAQEADRSDVQCTHPNWLLGERRHENYGRALTSAYQVALQLEPIHVRHLNIRDQTRRVVHARRAQVIFRGCKRVYRVSYRP